MQEGLGTPFQPPCPREREGMGRSQPTWGSGRCSQAGPPGAAGMMEAAAFCLHLGSCLHLEVDQSSTSLSPAAPRGLPPLRPPQAARLQGPELSPTGLACTSVGPYLRRGERLQLAQALQHSPHVGLQGSDGAGHAGVQLCR